MGAVLVPDMDAVLVGSAPAEPVSSDELLEYLKLDADQDRALVESLAVAAREHLELFTRRKFMQAEFDLWFDRFPDPSSYLVLVPSPLVSVTEIEYLDDDGAPQTLASSVYDADTAHLPGRVRLAWNQTWPSFRRVPNAIRVRFKAGATGADDDAQRANVPERAKLTIKAMTERYYDLGRAPETILEIFKAAAWGLRVADL